MGGIEAMFAPKPPYASEFRAGLREYRRLSGATVENDPVYRQMADWVRILTEFERIDRAAYKKLRALREQGERSERWAEHQKRRQTKRERPLCGAKTRAGGTCKARCVVGKTKCRCHGGLSSGPRTEAGRAAIVASNQKRAELRRLHRQNGDLEANLNSTLAVK